TEMLLNAVARSDIQQDIAAQFGKIRETIQHKTRWTETEQNEGSRISSAVLSTTQPPLRGGGAHAGRRYVANHRRRNKSEGGGIGAAVRTDVFRASTCAPTRPFPDCPGGVALATNRAVGAVCDPCAVATVVRGAAVRSRTVI